MGSLTDGFTTGFTKGLIGYSIGVTGSIEDQLNVGRYLWHSADINDCNFHADQRHHVMGFLKPFETLVVEEMQKDRFRYGSISELLAFGIKHPELQQEGSRIVALNSIWHREHDGTDYVGCLAHADGGRVVYPVCRADRTGLCLVVSLRKSWQSPALG